MTSLGVSLKPDNGLRVRAHNGAAYLQRLSRACHRTCGTSGNPVVTPGKRRRSSEPYQGIQRHTRTPGSADCKSVGVNLRRLKFRHCTHPGSTLRLTVVRWLSRPRRYAVGHRPSLQQHHRADLRPLRGKGPRLVLSRASRRSGVVEVSYIQRLTQRIKHGRPTGVHR